MRKKGKLYTANKWNQPLFMPKENLFSPGGDFNTIQPEGIKIQQEPKTNTPNYIQLPEIFSTNQGTQQNTSQTQSGGGFNWQQGLSIGMNTVPQNSIKAEDAGFLGDWYKGDEFKRGAWDAADPMYYIAEGRESELGNAFEDAGVSMMKSLPPGLGWILAAAAKGTGDTINFAAGTKTDKPYESVLKDQNSYLSNYTSNAGSFDGLQAPIQIASYKDVYEGPNKAQGWGAAAANAVLGGFTPLSLALSAGLLYGNKKARNKTAEKNAALRKQYEDSIAWAQNSLDNNIMNIKKDQINNALANYSADGGYLDMSPLYDMPAVMVDYMKDYTRAKQDTADAKNNNMTSIFAGVPSTMFARGGKIHINPKNRGKFNATKKRTGKTTAQLAHSKNPLTRKRAIFAMNARKWNHKHDLGGPMFIGSLPQAGIFDLGGDIQMNGGDFTDGLVQINAGLSHEMNPYDGVQMGVDPQGIPNLVEEGETVFDDYVFSNRIEADEKTLDAFHLAKNKKMTYAELSKLIEKKSEVAEKPNDPIAKAGFEAMIASLRDNQERQKEEMEAQRAKEAFEALPPEEQVAIMQDAAQQEQMAQAAEAEEAMAQQEAMQQPSPEEIAAQQQMMADGSQANLGEQPQIAACGGNINKFPWGGYADLFSGYAPSNTVGLLPYDRTLTEDKVIELENAQAFKDFTEFINSYWDNPNLDEQSKKYIEEYLRALDAATGGNHLFDKNGKMLDSAKEYFNNARVNNHKWGYYHQTPKQILEAAANGNQSVVENPFTGQIFLEDDRGAWTPVDTVPEGYQLFKDMPEKNWKIYGKPARAGNPAEEPGVEEGNAKVNPGNTEEEGTGQEPIHRAEWPRYTGLFGPAVGIGMMQMGIGRPDYRELNRAVAAAKAAPELAGYKTIGDYMEYKPMDINFEQNKMDANARATERAIMNSTNPAKYAGLVANAYNNQLADSELYRRALEYNDANKARSVEFNRGTNQFNAQAYTNNSQYNAETKNRARQFATSLAYQAALEKMQNDADWYSNLYGNVNGLFAGLSDLGRENMFRNMASEQAADGIYGDLGDSYTGRRYLSRRKNNKDNGTK